MDQVGDGAKLLGLTQAQVIGDQRLNILAAAALLDADMRARGLSKVAPEAMREVLEAAMGLSQLSHKGKVAEHVRESFAFSVLSALDKGADDSGVSLIKGGTDV